MQKLTLADLVSACASPRRDHPGRKGQWETKRTLSARSDHSSTAWVNEQRRRQSLRRKP